MITPIFMVKVYKDKAWSFFMGDPALYKIMRLVVYNVAWADAYLRTKRHLDPSSRLATIDMGRKVGVLWSF